VVPLGPRRACRPCHQRRLAVPRALAGTGASTGAVSGGPQTVWGRRAVAAGGRTGGSRSGPVEPDRRELGEAGPPTREPADPPLEPVDPPLGRTTPPPNHTPPYRGVWFVIGARMVQPNGSVWFRTSWIHRHSFLLPLRTIQKVEPHRMVRFFVTSCMVRGSAANH
jgi:hypothetical protein